MNPISIYRLAMDALQRDYAHIITVLVQAYLSAGTTAARDKIIDQIMEETRRARRVAYRAGVSFIRASAQVQGVTDPYIPPARGYSRQAVVTTLRRGVRGDVDDARAEAVVRAIAGVLANHVEAAARDAVHDTSQGVEQPPERDDEDAGIEIVFEDGDDDEDEAAPPDLEKQARAATRPKRRGVRPKCYARVVTGTYTCAFCLMLASRGGTYKTAELAGEGNKYHPNCDCIVVPIYNYKDNWPGKEQYLAARKFYYKAVKDAEKLGGDATKRNPVMLQLERNLRAAKDAGRQPIPAVRATTT